MGRDRKNEFDEEELRLQLRILEIKWSKQCWIYVAAGTLHLMKRDSNGNRAVLPGGGVDPKYIVESFDIPSDGGDW